MSLKRSNSPQFRVAIMGYNKAEVDDYVARTESEFEIQESRQGKWEQRIAELNQEIERLNIKLDAERAEKQELLDKSLRLNRTIADLENQVQIVNNEKSKCQQEFRDLQESMDSSGVNLKTIQEAILNAQRMSEILIAEANDKAEEILHRAEAERREKVEAGRKAVEAAETEALRVTEAAEKRCDNLQRDYDRILMDVTEFKAELMKMYRRHMELLATLPEKGIPDMSQGSDVFEADYEAVEIKDIGHKD